MNYNRMSEIKVLNRMKMINRKNMTNFGNVINQFYRPWDLFSRHIFFFQIDKAFIVLYQFKHDANLVGSIVIHNYFILSYKPS